MLLLGIQKSNNQWSLPPRGAQRGGGGADSSVRAQSRKAAMPGEVASSWRMAALALAAQQVSAAV